MASECTWRDDQLAGCIAWRHKYLLAPGKCYGSGLWVVPLFEAAPSLVVGFQEGIYDHIFRVARRLEYLFFGHIE